MTPKFYSILLVREGNRYRLGINGEDFYYNSIWDVQKRIAGLVFPEPNTSAVEVNIRYN